jgi:ELWxxDGT repeat protein
VFPADALPPGETPGSFIPTQLTASGGRLFFTTGFGGGFRKLWSSDGTPQGTVMLKDTGPSDYAFELIDLGGTLFFRTGGPNIRPALWRSDGSVAGTTQVREFTAGPSHLTPINGTLYFDADDGVWGAEPWKSDGTPAGTVLIKDVYPGFYGSGASNFAAAGDSVVFSASDPDAFLEVWRTDGTAAGTSRVIDLAPGPDHGVLPETTIRSAGGLAYFIGTTVANEEWAMWRTDGTAAGTIRISDIPARGDFNPNVQAFAGAALFPVQRGDGVVELYRTLGTPQTTVPVAPISSPAGAFLTRFVPGDGAILYFVAGDLRGNSSDPALWRTDGTAAGTSRVSDLAPGHDHGLLPERSIRSS